MKILKLNSIYHKDELVPKRFFQQVLGFYSLGVSKNLWKNYSIKIGNQKKNRFTIVTFYKTNYLYAVITVKYQYKNQMTFLEIIKNEKKEKLSNLNEMHLWFKDYFLDRAKI